MTVGVVAAAATAAFGEVAAFFLGVRIVLTTTTATVVDLPPPLPAEAGRLLLADFAGVCLKDLLVPMDDRFLAVLPPPPAPAAVSPEPDRAFFAEEVLRLDSRWRPLPARLRVLPL